MMKYEDFVRKCCSKNWKDTTEEYAGGIGVACLKAFLDGVPPNISQMANCLGVQPSDVKEPFERLLVNGIFGRSYGAQQDTVLKGSVQKSETLHAWCTIAGIASGFVGLKPMDYQPVQLG